MVNLRREGNTYGRYVHRLVLEAFVGPCPKGMLCRHFPDQSPANNALDNIQWGTPKANMADKIANGTHLVGEQIAMAKLTPEIVRAIRAEYATGRISQDKIAKRLGMAQGAIGSAIRGDTWKHVV